MILPDLARAVRHLRRADPVLRALIDRAGPCGLRIDRRITPFEALARSILYQQISGKAAASIHARLLSMAGGRLRPDVLTGASDAALRGCGLSRQKIGYLRDLAARSADGLPTRRQLGGLDDAAAIEALTIVKGVGPWTAEMFLMFRLGRPDVLPVSDYGIRKAMQRAWRMRELPRPDRMCRLAEPWRPYRTIACWYLWRSLEG